MFKQIQRHRIASTAAVAVAGVAVAFPATSLAQEQEFRIEEIIVTAQKREQGLQSVPISVTAIDSEGIKAAGIENILDLQFNTPNLLLGRNSNYTIRGVGTTIFGSSRDAGVGVAVNGVFVQNPVATAEMYDLERVEVLRGPQGTLFGRNTTGGLINHVTAKADPEFGASISVQVEDPEGLRSTGHINFAISDNVWQRFAYNYVNRDGYTENLFLGHRIDGRDQIAIRSSTHFEIGDSTSADLVIDYYDEDSNRNTSPKALCTPDPVFICSTDSREAGFPLVNYPIDNSLLPGAVRADRYLTNPTSLRQVNYDFEPRYTTGETIVSFELTHSFGSVDFTSVTGYYENEEDRDRDFDLGAAPFGFNPGDYNTPFGPVTIADDGQGNGILTYIQAGQVVSTTHYSPTQTAVGDSDQWSQEFRLASNNSGALNWLLGAYYLDYDRNSRVTTNIPAGRDLGIGGVQGFTAAAPVESTAVFGELYWQVNDTFELITGLRWTDEDKGIKTQTSNFFPATSFTEDTDSFSKVTGRLVANWTPEVSWSESTLFYGSYSTGYKSGGFNPGLEAAPTYGAEEVKAYEIGTKNLLADNTLQLNGALFYYDYENLTLGNLVGTSITNVNVPKSVNQGAEIEMVWLPTDTWRLEAAVGLLDTEIDSEFSPPDPARGNLIVPLQGNDLPNAPGTTIKLAAQYYADIWSGWSLVPRIDWYWQDEFFSREFNTNGEKVDSWEQLDLQFVLQQNDGPWRINLSAKNLTDENSETFVETNSSLVGSFKNVFLLDPRVYSINVEYSFD
jgi:outer membrane receptor protein involved in Fe transport